MDAGDESLLQHEPPLLAALARPGREAGVSIARDDSARVPEDRLAVLKLVFPPRCVLRRGSRALPPQPFRPANGPRPVSEFNDGEGNRYVVYVRRDALSRADLSALERNLERKLRAKQARDAPVCPVREECFSEAFDELIRQVILECPERGLLLARARDQLRMTLAAYMTVYQDRCVPQGRSGPPAELQAGPTPRGAGMALSPARHLRPASPLPSTGRHARTTAFAALASRCDPPTPTPTPAVAEGPLADTHRTEQVQALEREKRDMELRVAELRTKHQVSPRSSPHQPTCSRA